MTDRDPAAIHETGLGVLVENIHGEFATLADFPTPGHTGRLARATDSGIVYRDDSTAWQAWMTPGSGGGGGPTVGSYDQFADTTGTADTGSAFIIPWVVLGSGAGNVVPDTDGSGNPVGRVTVSGTYFVAASVLQWAPAIGPTFIDAQFFIALEVARSGVPYALSSVATARSLATDTIRSAAGPAVLPLPMLAGDLIYAGIQASGGAGSANYGLEAIVTAIA